ncbi:Hypothetical predicted protein [Olea europaea subsp. europaea]|uniref:Uncharacterized protein n=1 Tax=Olea europaea subsp. europaea TaxID=158383 RepID=A0A8S0RBM8_OLEEU|nr:Hypothetical predicted protein [Olea europaea subsp. europaea]
MAAVRKAVAVFGGSGAGCQQPRGLWAGFGFRLGRARLRRRRGRTVCRSSAAVAKTYMFWPGRLPCGLVVCALRCRLTHKTRPTLRGMWAPAVPDQTGRTKWSPLDEGPQTFIPTPSDCNFLLCQMITSGIFDLRRESLRTELVRQL